MSNLKEAADAIRRQLKTLESWQLAADALDKLGSLDQAEREANDRAAHAEKRAAAAAELLSGVEKEITAAQASLATVLEQTRERAARITADAEASAAVAIAEAQARADSLLADARTQAQSALDDASAQAGKAQIEREQALAQAAKVGLEAAESRRELAELESKIANARGRIAELLK